jgi:hypothetical protein
MFNIPHDIERRKAVADLHLHIHRADFYALKGDSVNASDHLLPPVPLFYPTTIKKIKAVNVSFTFTL